MTDMTLWREKTPVRDMSDEWIERAIAIEFRRLENARTPHWRNMFTRELQILLAEKYRRLSLLV